MPVLSECAIETPLGMMIALGDEDHLYELKFGRALYGFTQGKTAALQSIEEELQQYFAGKLARFCTPIYLKGTPFQQRVWAELQKIPVGQTCSYVDIAQALSTSARAIGGANRANSLAIIVPCHRVIYADGSLGGYNGGLSHKQWLLNHEKNV